VLACPREKKSRDEMEGVRTCLWKESSMLVLSRKKNESIIINDDITIVVVEIRGDKVRLGVEAPKEVPVHRNEVYEAIRRNQQKPDASGSVVHNDGSNLAD
jgi:carbon storage regulator